MIDEKQLYIDAIRGLDLHWDDTVKFLPKRLYNIENYKYKAVKSELEAMDVSELKTLCDILQNKGMDFDGFNPICEEQIEFNDLKKKHVEERMAKHPNNLSSMAYGIDFDIMHSMAVQYPKWKEMMCKNGILTERCCIPREEMEKRTEIVKENKLKELITRKK